MQQLSANSNMVNPSFPVVQTSLASFACSKIIIDAQNDTQYFEWKMMFLIPFFYCLMATLYPYFTPYIILIIYFFIYFLNLEILPEWKNKEFGQDFGMTGNLTEIIATYCNHSHQLLDGWKFQKNGQQICASVWSVKLISMCMVNSVNLDLLDP